MDTQGVHDILYGDSMGIMFSYSLLTTNKLTGVWVFFALLAEALERIVGTFAGCAAAIAGLGFRIFLV